MIQARLEVRSEMSEPFDIPGNIPEKGNCDSHKICKSILIALTKIAQVLADHRKRLFLEFLREVSRLLPS
jgi:hypothetical protein